MAVIFVYTQQTIIISRSAKQFRSTEKLYVSVLPCCGHTFCSIEHSILVLYLHLAKPTQCLVLSGDYTIHFAELSILAVYIGQKVMVADSCENWHRIRQADMHVNSTRLAKLPIM